MSDLNKKKLSLVEKLRPKNEVKSEEMINKYNKEIFAKSENEGASDIY